jgi:hypothetical protein
MEEKENDPIGLIAQLLMASQRFVPRDRRRKDTSLVRSGTSADSIEVK